MRTTLRLRDITDYSKLIIISFGALGIICFVAYLMARNTLSSNAAKCALHAPNGQTQTSGASFFQDLTKVYTPRAACMFYESPVIWLHFFSDLLIAIAYYSIPIALVYFVIKRKDIAFHWIFIMFATFILACGTTHIFGVWDLWAPLYKIDGIVRLLTAMVSIATAIVLWPLIPKALALPSPAQLEQQIAARTTELGETNRVLRSEIETRERMEKEREELLKRERTARSNAEHANKMKDEFLATLSHELRTPLNAILGWSQLIRKESVSQADLKQGLATIERNARVQTQLIEDLLDMNRIISGKLSLDVQSVELHTVIEAAIAAVKPAADAKSIAISKFLDPRTDSLRGDSNRLQQVFWNLLSNAVKFTPRGGKIDIRAERVGSHVQIFVTDTGQGITEEFLPHVFDRFRQQDASTSRRHAGLGIGLSIVKSIVEMHGGQVRVNSPGQGQGATFIVELPVHAVQVGSNSDGRHTASPSHDTVPIDKKLAELSGVSVLVVDDEADALRLLKHVLESHGATVTTTNSGPEALAVLENSRFDLVISDIGMPDMDGYQLIHAIRGLPGDRGGQTPAVALTAFARSQDRTRALVSGYQSHVVKPVETAELIAVIASLIRR